jgi:hypothetical protein
MLAWLRRIIVSVGIGGFSYALMLGFMVLSVIYDKEFEPAINFATGRLTKPTLPDTSPTPLHLSHNGMRFDRARKPARSTSVGVGVQ